MTDPTETAREKVVPIDGYSVVRAACCICAHEWVATIWGRIAITMQCPSCYQMSGQVIRRK